MEVLFFQMEILFFRRHLSRELTFIQTMNLSNKNDSIWQNELFSFLKELENLLLEYLEKGEEEAENLREFLMDEFEKLKG